MQCSVPALECNCFLTVMVAPLPAVCAPSGCFSLCCVSCLWLQVTWRAREGPVEEFEAKAVVGSLAVAGLACVGSVAGVSLAGVWACCLFSFPAW